MFYQCIHMFPAQSNMREEHNGCKSTKCFLWLELNCGLHESGDIKDRKVEFF